MAIAPLRREDTPAPSQTTPPGTPPKLRDARSNGRLASTPSPTPHARPRRERSLGRAVLAWLDSVTWTEKAYFALPESNHIVELVDGRLVIPDMPTIHHQRVVRDFAFRLHDWNAEHKAGEVLFSAYPIRLKPGLIREPDVMFYLNEHRSRMQVQRGGPPDLVVEVLSPSTRRIDQGAKLAQYAEARVTEYWLMDPDQHWVEVHALENGRYQHLGRFSPGEEATSRLLPGFTVAVADLFSPSPSLGEAGAHSGNGQRG